MKKLSDLSFSPANKKFKTNKKLILSKDGKKLYSVFGSKKKIKLDGKVMGVYDIETNKLTNNIASLADLSGLVNFSVSSGKFNYYWEECAWRLGKTSTGTSRRSGSFGKSFHRPRKWQNPYTIKRKENWTQCCVVE